MFTYRSAASNEVLSLYLRLHICDVQVRRSPSNILPHAVRRAAAAAAAAAGGLRLTSMMMEMAKLKQKMELVGGASGTWSSRRRSCERGEGHGRRRCEEDIQPSTSSSVYTIHCDS